jgi:hypothetical protein
MVFAKEAESHNDRVVASTQGEIRNALMFAARITFARFSVWSAMNSPNSAGVIGIACWGSQA